MATRNSLGADGNGAIDPLTAPTRDSIRSAGFGKRHEPLAHPQRVRWRGGGAPRRVTRQAEGASIRLRRRLTCHPQFTDRRAIGQAVDQPLARVLPHDERDVSGLSAYAGARTRLRVSLGHRAPVLRPQITWLRVGRNRGYCNRCAIIRRRRSAEKQETAKKMPRRPGCMMSPLALARFGMPALTAICQQRPDCAATAPSRQWPPAASGNRPSFQPLISMSAIHD